MPMKVEYLVVLDKDQALCDSSAGFAKLLTANSDVLIEGDRLEIKGHGAANIHLRSGSLPEKRQLHFLLAITLPGSGHTEDQICQFAGLVRAVRGVAAKSGGVVDTLWDDISLHYSMQAYPQIFEIECLMRKLITQFMTTTVGRDWVASTSPAEVEDALRKGKRKNDALVSVLYSVDFSHLGDFLFRAYTKTDPQKLYAAIRSASSPEEFSALKTLVPVSNWRRYFAKIVDCEDLYLETRWAELYELRCKVAHNAEFKKLDLDRLQALIRDVRPRLVAAIEKLAEVTVPDEERADVVESVEGSVFARLGRFLTEWKALERTINDALARRGRTLTPLRHAMNALREQKIVSEDDFFRLVKLNELKNRAVHGPGEVAAFELELATHEIYLLRTGLLKIEQVLS